MQLSISDKHDRAINGVLELGHWPAARWSAAR